MLEALQPRTPGQHQGHEQVPQRVDGHAQQADGGLGEEVHVRLQHLGEDSDQKQGDFRVEEGDGKAFGKALSGGTEVVIEQCIVVGVPH